MQWKHTLFALVVAFSLALAGCVQEDEGEVDDGQPDEEEEFEFNTAEVSFDQNMTGAQTSTVECPEGDGSIGVTGDITNGAVVVKVMDTNNSVVFNETFEAEQEVAVEGEILEGEAGTWTLWVDAASAAEEFDGEIQATLTC